MSLIRSGSPGATRVCPHCKATVLESAAVCPGCKHHLRFGGTHHALEAGEGYCALSVDGTIAHTKASEPCEYCVVLDVRDDRGEQLTRQVVGVGVLQTGERRRLNVTVEMLPVRSASASKSQAAGKPASAPSTPAVPGAPGTPKPATITPPAAPTGTAAAATANANANAKSTGPQQPANLIHSSASAASMQRLGIIRKPR
jgi:hypothetical protein